MQDSLAWCQRSLNREAFPTRVRKIRNPYIKALSEGLGFDLLTAKKVVRLTVKTVHLNWRSGNWWSRAEDTMLRVHGSPGDWVRLVQDGVVSPRMMKSLMTIAACFLPLLILS